MPITLHEKQIRSIVDLTGLGENTIHRVIDGLNDVLAGDPVGTIRRSPDGRVVAVRVDDLDRPYETCVPEGSASWRSDSIHTWPVIYRPEEDSL
ncbi:hypothetical protein [Nocardia wallacei]|uniref:hypothetical protein n=1 Tax=Nocardia wallacei TaxID=480035 RepID=UPI0024565CAE|nr:hypothetical protein [Nocardia wallacei]